MRSITKMFLVLAVLAVAAAAVQAEQIDNPEYLQWKAFKAGAMVKRDMVTKMAGNETKMTQTITLKEITPEKAVISQATTMVVGGNTIAMPAQDRDVPAKIEKPTTPAPEANPDMETETGEETIKVGDKELKCKWVKTKMKSGGNTTVSKMWTSDEVPGQMVKMESTSEGAMSSTTTIMTTEYKTE